MARRKEAKPQRTAASRTTASVFQNYQPEEQAVEKPKDEAPQQDNDDPQNHLFPLNYIYEFQDFLNDNMDFCKGVQVMTLLYICQIVYLYLREHNEWAAMSAVGFSLLGSLLATVFHHRSQWKRHNNYPEKHGKPVLPEFNVIYAFFIPILLFLLLSDTKSSFFQVNLALNNYALRPLNVLAKVLSSFVFYYMYNENDTVDVLVFSRVVLLYFGLEHALDYFNELSETGETPFKLKTMLSAEIHMVCIFMINLVFNFKTTALPLVIFRELVLALLAAIFAAFQVHFVYSRMTQGFAKKALSVVMVAVFGAVFYFATDLQFQREVKPVSPVVWLAEYILELTPRFRLMAFWVGTLVTTIPVVFGLAYTNKISLNMRRKIWHFLLVVCLLNRGFVEETDFVAIALLGSVVLFVVLETVRATRLTFVGEFLFTELRFFQDEKDLKGPLNLLYIFLLVGVAFPLAYGYLVGDVVSIRSFIGLVTLGLGDLLASIVGKRYGKIKWRGASRTVEGSVTFIVVVFAAFVAIDAFLLPEGHRVDNWENLFIVVLVGGFIEGSSTLNDNVLIPCVLTLVFDLLARTFRLRNA